MELHGYVYTWNKLVVTTWNYQMLVALLLVSCNWNDMVINTLEINQIHVIFYWVSEYKPRYLLSVLDNCVLCTFALHLADDDIMPNLLVIIIAYKTHWLHFVSSHFCWHWFGISIIVDKFPAFVILNVVVFFWNPDSHSWDLLIAVYLINNFLDKTE